MNMQLGDILTGKAGRGRKPQAEAIIENIACIRIAEFGTCRQPWGRGCISAHQPGQCIAGIWPGHPDNRNPGPATAAGQGKDGV